MPYHAIGQIIRDRRRELGLTQEDLAERISAEGEYLRQSDISRIESGQVKLPRPERLQRIAHALDLSFGDLLLSATGTDEEGQVLIDASDDRRNGPDATESMWSDERIGLRLLENVEQAVIVTNPEGTIRYWNAYAEHLYGWSADEAIGQVISEVTVAEAWEWQEQADAIMAHLGQGQRWSGEFLVRHRDGNLFMAHVTLAPVLDHEGQVIAIFGTSHEVARRPASSPD